MQQNKLNEGEGTSLQFFLNSETQENPLDICHRKCIHTNLQQKNKLREFQQILGEDFEIDAQGVDLPELQGNALDIASEKALTAYKQVFSFNKQLKRACVVEDTSLCFNAFKGMPGPYIKWFLDAIEPEGLSKLLDSFDDKTAYAQCIISYMAPHLEKPIQFVGKTDGQIVRPRGDNKFGWDPIFQPDGFDQTYAELDKDIKNKISHRFRAIDKMIEHFKKIIQNFNPEDLKYYNVFLLDQC
ncbi:hypothetical protein pb186bvf_001711 [Paramecium bursaria]